MSLPLPTSPDAPPFDERASLRSRWWLFVVLGLVSAIVGLLAIVFPHIATSGFVVVFGVLLLIAGFTEVIHAVMVRKFSGFALHLLSAALYLLVGLFMLENPPRAKVVLTLLLAASFLVGGLLRIISSALVQAPAWSWILLNGVVDVILGILIWNRWPDSSFWVIGLFVGIDLLFHGWSWIILGLTVRPENTAPSV
jgi:uncharacterized membrane protein HdeD (DUF308 family)